MSRTMAGNEQGVDRVDESRWVETEDTAMLHRVIAAPVADEGMGEFVQGDTEDPAKQGREHKRREPLGKRSEGQHGGLIAEMRPRQRLEDKCQISCQTRSSPAYGLWSKPLGSAIERVS